MGILLCQRYSLDSCNARGFFLRELPFMMSALEWGKEGVQEKYTKHGSSVKIRTREEGANKFCGCHKWKLP